LFSFDAIAPVFLVFISLSGDASGAIPMQSMQACDAARKEYIEHAIQRGNIPRTRAAAQVVCLSAGK
jgi:hypothetical protein